MKMDPVLGKSGLEFFFFWKCVQKKVIFYIKISNSLENRPYFREEILQSNPVVPYNNVTKYIEVLPPGKKTAAKNH